MSNIRGLPKYGPDDADFSVHRQLESLEQKNPDLYAKAKVLGARAALLGALRTINLIHKYELVSSFISWDEILNFIKENKIPEAVINGFEIATIAAFYDLENNPNLANKIDPKISQD